MGQKIGILAGSGEVPFLVREEARKKGYEAVLVGLSGMTDEAAPNESDGFFRAEANDIYRIISFFKEHGITRVVPAGKIDPKVLVEEARLNEGLKASLDILPDNLPSTVLEMAFAEFSKAGLDILDPTIFLKDYFCPEGILGRVHPSEAAEKDIDFGWKTARSAADLDIGQTLVVKNRIVVAVEGMEGTDAAVERGGKLAGPFTVVVKVCRSSQDPRIDLPAVGMGTVRKCVEARCSALCLEAEAMPFFQRQEAVALADSQNMAVVARKRNGLKREGNG